MDKIVRNNGGPVSLNIVDIKLQVGMRRRLGASQVDTCDFGILVPFCDVDSPAADPGSKVDDIFRRCDRSNPRLALEHQEPDVVADFIIILGQVVVRERMCCSNSKPSERREFEMVGRPPSLYV